VREYFGGASVRGRSAAGRSEPILVACTAPAPRVRSRSYFSATNPSGRPARPEACAACAVACDAVGQLGTLCYERMGAASVCDDLVSSATKKPPVSL
jgi:hypothetical protein